MRVVAISCFLLLSAVCMPAIAQTAPLEENQKAVLVFDIRMDSIRGSKLAQELKLADKFSAMQSQSGDEGLDPASLDRIFGAMSAPEDMQSAMSIEMGEMPMNFFVKMYFNDEAAVNKLFAKIENENGGTVDHDGQTFYKTPEQAGAPAGILIHKVDTKTVEVGTETFLFQPNRNLLTDNLAAAAQGTPEAAVRLAMDFAGAKGLVAEMVAMGKQNAPDPTVGVYMDLIDNIKDISIVIDVSGGDLLTVKANGVNEEDAVELKEGLDSLLGMAKMGIQGALPMIREQDADGAAVAENFANSLSASNEGTVVSIKIPTPTGFNAWVGKQAEQLELLFGG